MQKKQLVKQILGERFAEFGFSYNDIKAREMYEFKRVREDGIEQYIRIYSAHYAPNWLFLDISSKYGHGLRVNEFAPESKYANKQWWEFKDKNELVEALEEMGDVIEKYGLDKLEELSIPEYKYEPTEEMHRRLFEQHDELAKRFKKKHNINENLTLKDSIFLLKDMLEKYDRIEYDDETKEWLLEMAAFYGERMIRRYNGCWGCYDDTKKSFVNKLQNNCSTIFVLTEIANAWEKANTEIMMIGYEVLIGNENVPIFNGKKYVEAVINKDC